MSILSKFFHRAWPLIEVMQEVYSGSTMFQGLSNRLQAVAKTLLGQGRITESNIKETLREIRIALLEADTALPVVTEVLEHIKQKALGQTVMHSINPGQLLVKIVQDELTTLMGEACVPLNLAAEPPVVILMAGLQGSGKTTTVAKLARLLKERQNKKVMVASCDVYRPAAIDQLKTLAEEVGVTFFPSHPTQSPLDIAALAIKEARIQLADVVILDTAGRLHIDEAMMTEIKSLHAATNPTETLFVVDSMSGQDAAKTAKAFHDALPLTGIILTKTDGDARGGAALSIRYLTGKPIKFLGVGEKTGALEAFYPDRIASRILGMGDVVGLVEEAEQRIDKAKAEKLAKKLQKGKGFDLEDFLDQLTQMKQMGGVASILGKIPGLNAIPQAAKEQINDKSFVKMAAIIQSMTPQERRFPAVINGSRKRRIAEGSGTDLPAVNRLLKQFVTMQTMMKKMKKGGMSHLLRGLPGGGFPGGGFPFQ